MLTGWNPNELGGKVGLTTKAALPRLVVPALAAIFLLGQGGMDSGAQEADASAPRGSSPQSLDSADSGEAASPPALLVMSGDERARLYKYRVAQVLSGHSVTIEVAGRFVLMKLLGVESARRESANFLKEVLADEEVFLEYDPDPRNQTDAQGNPVAYLYRATDLLFVNHALVAQGYCGLARILGPRAECLKEAYRLARINNHGLWSQGKLDLTWTPSIGFLETINHTRSRRARRRQAWRDWNEGVVDAYLEGRRQGAMQAGAESAFRARSSAGQLGGYGKITIKNGCNSGVKVHLASESFSKDLVVPANGTRSFAIPIGHYQEVSYQLERDPGGPYDAESFSLSYDPVELEIKPKTDKDSDLAKK